MHAPAQPASQFGETAFTRKKQRSEKIARGIFALMVTYAWIPMLIMGLATPFFWFYPLTEAVQRDLRAQIAARRSEEWPA